VWNGGVVATGNPASSLYLDQKDWIALARLKAGKPCPDGFSDAAVDLMTRISAGDIFTPLSESHVVETGRISNPKQRQEVATDILIVSQRCAIAPLQSLWPQEADSFFCRQFGAAVAAEPEPFGKGLAFALGVDFTPPWPPDAPEGVIAMTEMLAIAEPNRTGPSQADTERERRRDDWKRVMTESTEWLVKDRTKYNESDRLAAFTLHMLDGGGLLARAIGLDVQDEFLDFLGTEGFWAVVQGIPSLAILSELMRLRYPNVNEPWKLNDYNDMRFLSVALAYCSAVCCDHYWGDLAQRSEYITKRGVFIGTGELAIASALDQL
jgi:hypothetical protein